MKKKAWYCFIGFSSLDLAAREFWNSFFGWGKMWPLLDCFFFAYKSFESLLRRHLIGSVFTGFGALIIKYYLYDLTSYPNHSFFWASILVVLGVGYLTH